MNTLLWFLRTFKNFFIFILLELVCVVLMVKNSSFQRFQILTSCNYVAGSMYSMRQDVVRYFSLADVNEDLSKLNTSLQAELARARIRIAQLESDTSYAKRLAMAEEKHYTFTTACVINRCASDFKNIFTIDKGRADGVKADQGVICDKGVVGIVSNVSDHYAVVIPIISNASAISAKVKGKNSSSSLVWDGKDTRYAKLNEVPLYVPVADGDSVVTSGYSSIFPEGLMIGYVEEHKKGSDDFHLITVRLSTDFEDLSFVDVVSLEYAEEEAELEKKEMANE